MIKITNGVRTTTCTKGAFENWYKPMGWKIADESDVKVEAEVLPEEENKPLENVAETPEEEFEEEVEPESEDFEIPLSEMKLSELKEYAEEHGIDISDAKTKRDIRDIIKSEMEE